jgi:hypothetical protein
MKIPKLLLWVYGTGDAQAIPHNDGGYPKRGTLKHFMTVNGIRITPCGPHDLLQISKTQATETENGEMTPCYNEWGCGSASTTITFKHVMLFMLSTSEFG